MLKWLFFDVGNVLFNDDLLSAFIFETMYDRVVAAGRAVSFDEMIEKGESLIAGTNSPSFLRPITPLYLKPSEMEDVSRTWRTALTADFFRFNLIVPGYTELLEKLGASYNLGIASNHVLACRQALAQAGLLPFFKIVAISSEINRNKPAPEFFEYVLSEAGCDPKEAVMIGDRIDNDIRPARRMGMKTIWVNFDLSTKGYQPQAPIQKAFFSSQCRIARQINPVTDEDRSDAVVTCVEEISRAIERLQDSLTE